MQAHTLSVSRTAHYYSLGQAGPEVRRLWIVCHGYGQLASTFVRRFEGVLDEHTLVLAPEGLSRFYWQGFDGPVAASWMTRADRLDEIADFCLFLSQLYQRYVPLCHPEVQIILLGFSQGCATQLRWLLRAFPRFHHLILWAGFLPDDLPYANYGGYFADKHLHLVYGLQDPFLTPERLALHAELIRQSGLQLHTRTFAGEHVVAQAELADLAEALKTW